MNDYDRSRVALVKFVRSCLPELVHLGFYPAKVVSQNADDTLELLPLDTTVPGLSSVKLYQPTPGARQLVLPGAQVLVFYEGGNPEKPRAILWDSGSATKIAFPAVQVQLGGEGPSVFDFLIKGTTFRIAHKAWHVTLGTLLSGGAAFFTSLSAGMGSISSGFTAITSDPNAPAWTTAGSNAIQGASSAAGAISTAATALAGLFTAAATALSTFEGVPDDYLSTTVQTK